jgi:uncharacterized protein YndB with AHSA1/START domain
MQRNLRTFSNGKVDSYDVTLTMQLAHSLDEIWGALVKVEKLQRWFGPVTGGGCQKTAYFIWARSHKARSLPVNQSGGWR